MNGFSNGNRPLISQSSWFARGVATSVRRGRCCRTSALICTGSAGRCGCQDLRPGHGLLPRRLAPMRSVFASVPPWRRRFWGWAASELRDSRVRLDQLWGGRAARELAERLSCRDDDDGRAIELENAVRRMAAGAWGLDVVALEVTGRLRTARTASARDLARATHLSERQLHRRCTAAFGYGPGFLLRIHRIQRFLQLARDESRPPRLAGLAIDAGYADQPHLTREVRSIMGTTPAQLLRGSPECPTGSRPEPLAGATLVG